MKVLILFGVIIVKLSIFPLSALAGNQVDTGNQVDSGSLVDPAISSEGALATEQNKSAQSGNELVVKAKSSDKIESEIETENSKSDPKLSKSASPISELPTVVFTLFLLIVGIFVLAWLARRYGTFGLTKGDRIEVKSSIPVGARERVSLIEVDGQKLLIGVTGQQVSLLHAFPERDDEDRSKVDADDPKLLAKSPFAEKLMSVMQKKDSESHDDPVSNIDRRAE